MTSVLVVDDREIDRELLAAVLGSAGYEVREASTGEQALTMAGKHPPDLVIAETMLPKMGGHELVRALRRDPTLATTPVILCPAGIGEGRWLAEACDVPHLVRPCEPQEILRVVSAALGSTLEPGPAVGVQTYLDHLRALNETLLKKTKELEGVNAEQQRLHEELGRSERETAESLRERVRVLNDKLLQKIMELEGVNEEQQRLHEELGRAERETSESLTLLETLQSMAPVGFGFVDCEYRVRRMNETLAAVNGAPVEEQLGKRVPDIVPEIWPQIEPLYRHVLDTGEALLNQEISTGESGVGEVRLASYYPVRVEGEIIGIGIVVIDITERTQAEEFHSVVTDTMAEGLLVSDGDGRLVFMNSAGARLLGWTTDELRGKPVHETIHFQHADGSAFPARECPLFEVRTEATTARILDDTFTTKDGALLPVAYSAAPLGSGDNIRGLVIVFRDITEEKAAWTRRQRELNTLTWVGRIREALDEKRFVLYSQPILSLKEGLLQSEELLLRMIGRDNEIIPPGNFLASAEKFGLIGEIDRWVVTEAIRLAASGRRVEANLSAASVGSTDLLPLIETELQATGADPANIVFELTETALLQNLGEAEAFARRLVNLGCKIALDDFGTGFGSFTYLKTLPIEYLKIDTEFVRELPSSKPNQHLVKAIVSLAEAFGQKTIAEGVEDNETLELLREYGVDFAQGYHLGRPGPLASTGTGTGGLADQTAERALARSAVPR